MPGVPNEFQATPSAPQKQSHLNRWIIITGAIVVILVLAGVSFLVYSNSTRSTPQMTLSTWCTARLQGDYQTAYNQFSRSMIQIQSQTEQQYAHESQQSDQSHSGLKSCTVGNVNESGSSATGQVISVWGDGFSIRDLFELTDENGTWRIIGATAG